MSARSPAARTLLVHRLTGVAEEMMATLVRTAYSPNIKERRDCSTAVFDARGRLVAQAAAIPVHLGAMPMSVAAALEAFPNLAPGELAILNDPFHGGTHLPDLTAVSAVCAGDGTPVGYLASRAHHADVGGTSPGSMPLSTSIDEEGLRLAPVLLVRDGSVQAPVLERILAATRTPDERAGDLRAQMAAHATGGRRLAALADALGAEALATGADDLLAYGEALMRAVIRALPDGRYAFRDFLDDDGAGTADIPIVVTIEVDGSAARVDFDGSGPACRGNLNAVEAITRSATYYAFLCLLATPSERRPEVPDPLPLNEGCFRPVEIALPVGSIVDAGPPHAVAGGNVETSQRIVDVVLGALAEAWPDVVPAASQGTMNNLTLGGTDPLRGRPFAFYETIGGGAGARRGAAGEDAVHSHMTNTRNTPAEALEFAYPLRVERYAIRRGTGGDGRWRGGDGIRRDVRLLADASGTLIAERRARGPWGLAGGLPGAPGAQRLLREGTETPLPAKARLELRAGDVLSIETPGGGGWGVAERRDG